jgi:hypothetical protein
VAGLRQLRSGKMISGIAVVVIMLLSVHYSLTQQVLPAYRSEAPLVVGRTEVGHKLWQNLDKYVPEGSFIFCDNANYLRYIMPYYPVHTLGAYRTMEYFQLPERIAVEFVNADQEVEHAADYAVVDSIAREYNITTAIISRIDVGVRLYEMLASHWTPVYSDEYFAILRKPEPDSAALPSADDSSP